MVDERSIEWWVEAFGAGSVADVGGKYAGAGVAELD